MIELAPTVLSGISLLSSDSWEAEEIQTLSPDVLEVSTEWAGGAKIEAQGMRIMVAAGFWYLMGTEESERLERLWLLQDFCKANLALSCVVKLPPAQRLDPEVIHSVLRFQKNWTLDPTCSLYFEPGRVGPPGWLEPKSCVVDPLWNPREIRSDYWKIHGWHAERWVRVYPKATLVSLARRAERLSPRFIILGHSQRKIQYATLRAAFKE